MTDPTSALSTIPPAELRAILVSERAEWARHRATLLIRMDVQLEIARTLQADKSAIIKEIESQLAECLVAIGALDARIAATPTA